MIVRQQGSTPTLAGKQKNAGNNSVSLSQHAALIEAACFGSATPRSRTQIVEADMLDAVAVSCLRHCRSCSVSGSGVLQSPLITYIINRPGKRGLPGNGPGAGSAIRLWRLDEIMAVRRVHRRRYAHIDRNSGCVKTADRRKRSFTLTCIAGRRFAISCAIYIAALIYPAFRFLRR